MRNGQSPCPKRALAERSTAHAGKSECGILLWRGKALLAVANNQALNDGTELTSCSHSPSWVVGVSPEHSSCSAYWPNEALSGYILPEDIVCTVTVKAYTGPLHGDRPSMGLNSLILQWKLM